MKDVRSFAVSAFCLAAVACASAQKPAVGSATLTSADASGKTAAELWAERKVAAEIEAAKAAPRQTRESFDPLATDSELEESSVPKTEMTPASQLRLKSPAELNLAIEVVKSSRSVEVAAKKLTMRLGKPTWTEARKGSDDAKRRIWIASAGAQCQRLVLEADGAVEVETAAKSEWRMLSASARQNPCTGEIKRGLMTK